MEKKNLIVGLTTQFAVLVVDYCESLSEKRQFVIANQLLRAGLSVGANVREAQQSESLADFIHKMKIAAKEAEECSYFLEVCQLSPRLLSPPESLGLIKNILRVLSSIIASAKARNK